MRQAYTSIERRSFLGLCLLAGGDVIAQPIKPTYFIYLSDIFGLLSPPQYIGVANELKTLFDPIIRLNGRYSSVEVLWIPTNFLKYPLDSLAVHITPPDCSIANEARGLRPSDPRDVLLTDGATFIHNDPSKDNGDGFVVSEVFGSTQDVTALSRLIFHEGMHNKLLMSSAQLHPLGGLASASIGPGTLLTPGNIQSMAAVLHLPRVQMKDALAKIIDRRLRRDTGDPNWNL